MLIKEIGTLRKQAHRVEEVMRQLPILSERKARIRDLAIDVVSIARGNFPATRGDMAAIRALRQLSDQLQKTRDIINGLPAEAEQVLSETPLGSFGLADYELARYAQYVEFAKERLEAKPVKKRGGRPESRAAFEVSCDAIRAYETLTGKRAGITTSATERGHPRSGEFLDFLTEIFKVCNISASPSSQAKKALAERASSLMPDYYPMMIAEAVRQALEEYVPPDGLKQKTPNKIPD